MARVCAFIRFMPTSSVGTKRTWWPDDTDAYSGLQADFNYWWGLRDDGPTVAVDGNGSTAPILSMKKPSGILWTTGSFCVHYDSNEMNLNPDGGGDNIVSSSYYHEWVYDFQTGRENNYMENYNLGSNVLPIFLDSTAVQSEVTDLTAGVFILTASAAYENNGSPYTGSIPDGYISDKLLRVYHTVETDSEGTKTFINDISDQIQWAVDNIPEYAGFVKDTGSYTPLDNLINMLWMGDPTKAIGNFTASQAGIYMTSSEGAIPAWYYIGNKAGPSAADPRHESAYTASFVKLATLQNP